MLAHVDTVHDIEVARLQERADRYSRSNRVLRDQTRFKSARAKENARQESSASDFSITVHRRAADRLRDSAVGVSHDVHAGSKAPEWSVESSALAVKVAKAVSPVHEGSAFEDEATVDLLNDYSAHDFTFLDSVDIDLESDKSYLRHFMTPSHVDGAAAAAMWRAEVRVMGGLSVTVFMLRATLLISLRVKREAGKGI